MQSSQIHRCSPLLEEILKSPSPPQLTQAYLVQVPEAGTINKVSYKGTRDTKQREPGPAWPAHTKR